MVRPNVVFLWLFSFLTVACGDDGSASSDDGTAQTGATPPTSPTSTEAAETGGPSSTPTTAMEPTDADSLDTTTGDPSGDPTTSDPTADPTSDPTSTPDPKVTLCPPLVPGRFATSDDELVPLAADPSGSSLYVASNGLLERWAIGGGTDCGLVHDEAVSVPVSGVVDLEATSDSEVFAGIEFSALSPTRVWPQPEVVCEVGPDDYIQSLSIASAGDTIVALDADDADNLRVWRAATAADSCSLSVDWTESTMVKDSYSPFALDATGRSHVFGIDLDDPDYPFLVRVFSPQGVLEKKYGEELTLCTGSRLVRCGDFICMLSCDDFYRFDTGGQVIDSIDLRDLFDYDFASYVEITGADDGTAYVVRLAPNEGPEGYAISIVRVEP